MGLVPPQLSGSRGLNSGGMRSARSSTAEASACTFIMLPSSDASRFAVGVTRSASAAREQHTADIHLET